MLSNHSLSDDEATHIFKRGKAHLISYFSSQVIEGMGILFGGMEMC